MDRKVVYKKCICGKCGRPCSCLKCRYCDDECSVVCSKCGKDVPSKHEYLSIYQEIQLCWHCNTSFMEQLKQLQRDFITQPDRSKREDLERGCGTQNIVETQ